MNKRISTQQTPFSFHKLNVKQNLLNNCFCSVRHNLNITLMQISYLRLICACTASLPFTGCVSFLKRFNFSSRTDIRNQLRMLSSPKMNWSTSMLYLGAKPCHSPACNNPSAALCGARTSIAELVSASEQKSSSLPHPIAMPCKPLSTILGGQPSSNSWLKTTVKGGITLKDVVMKILA